MRGNRAPRGTTFRRRTARWLAVSFPQLKQDRSAVPAASAGAEHPPPRMRQWPPPTCPAAPARLSVVLMTSPASSLPTSSSRIAAGGIALAAIGAIAASGKAVIVKLAYRHGVDATTLLALRMLMAFPLFALLAVWSARRAPALSWGDRGRVVWLGFTGYYLSSLLDFQGLQYISVTL